MSIKTFPKYLTRIDKLTRQYHRHLKEEDNCYFVGRYVIGRGYGHGPINQLIFNFKKPMDQRGKDGWHYKQKAIRDAAKLLQKVLRPDVLDDLTFVPIPPSKARNDPLYDDRMSRMLGLIRSNPPLDVRELVVQTESTEAAHSGRLTRDSDQIRKLYKIDEDLAEPIPKRIALVDDVLITGAHFKAAQSFLQGKFPNVPISGLFIARGVHANLDEFESLE